jgi:hypothetical protein
VGVTREVDRGADLRHFAAKTQKRDQGGRTQVRDILAQVYGWFTEGFGTLDLKHAKSMLDELAQ